MRLLAKLLRHTWPQDLSISVTIHLCRPASRSVKELNELSLVKDAEGRRLSGDLEVSFSHKAQCLKMTLLAPLERYTDCPLTSRDHSRGTLGVPVAGPDTPLSTPPLMCLLGLPTLQQGMCLSAQRQVNS